MRTIIIVIQTSYLRIARSISSGGGGGRSTKKLWVRFYSSSSSSFLVTKNPHPFVGGGLNYLCRRSPSIAFFMLYEAHQFCFWLLSSHIDMCVSLQLGWTVVGARAILPINAGSPDDDGEDQHPFVVKKKGSPIHTTNRLLD